MKIGVLALQGDFREHCIMLRRLGVEAVEIRKKSDLKDIEGLIIPGGESTTIGNLMIKSGLDSEIKKRYKKGMPIYGTCAGAILLANDIIGSNQPKLSLLDISVLRNSYGRQIDSFETDIKIEGFKKPFHAVFIRAPQIETVRDSIKILSKYNNKSVMARTDKILVSTFHPELTEDTRIHQYFVKMVQNQRFKTNLPLKLEK